LQERFFDLRFSSRTTSFNPDQISSTAHTLISTSPSGNAILRTTSSVISVSILAAFFGQEPQITASSLIVPRYFLSPAVSSLASLVNRWTRSTSAVSLATNATPSGKGANRF